MKRFYIICMSAILMICMSGMLYASPITQFVMDESNASLVSIIKNQYPSDSIEIFVSKNEFAQNDTLDLLGIDKLIIPFKCYIVFADFMPNANWGHKCEYLFVSNEEQQVSAIKQDMPPLHLSEKFDVYQQCASKYGDIIYPHSSSNPFRTTTRNQIKNHQTSILHKKYAVIISGGGDIDHNAIRYWNDCSAVYQTLINEGYPSNNIYVAMADGTDPRNDMPDGPWSYMSSPLDLDGNSTNDIQYAATIDNIQLIFDTLANKMTDDDDLFVFVTDHGGTTSGNTHSYIVLWNNAILLDTTFARMISPISARTKNIVMEQCYSGGFIDDVRGIENVVITTACDANELSYSMRYHDYDEFIYHLLTAINGYLPELLYPNYTQPNNSSIYVDLDGNGYITMDEAYIYAISHDTANEHPQQESYPNCLAGALTLHDLLDLCGGSLLVNGPDLYIKDNISDLGEEPNTTTNEFWISEDIWFEENGHRVYSLQSGETYDVCVRIRNRGDDISSNQATIYLHWAKAVIGGHWPYGWTDDVLYDCGGSYVQMGEMFGQDGLPQIESGASYVARIPWTTPESEVYSPCIEFSGDNLSELWHYCILARIVDEDEQPDETTNMTINNFVLNHNNVASCNITVMDVLDDNVTEPHLTGIVGITNPTIYEDSGPYQLVCNVWGGDYWDQSVIVSLTFSESFYENQTHLKWYGCQTNGIDYSFDLSSYSYFDSIYFSCTDLGFYPIKLDVIYQDTYEPGEYPEITISIQLVDSYGICVGGEDFRFRNARPDLANTYYTNVSQKQAQADNPINTQNIPSEIDVYNIHGQHVKHCTNTDIHSLTLPQGIYILRICDENQSYQVKIIK